MLGRKTLCAGEKAVRKFNNAINDIIIDQLAREDLTLEEREELAAEAKRMAAKNVKIEEENSEFWYKYGRNVGEIKGMLKGLGCFAVGCVIGIVIFGK